MSRLVVGHYTSKAEAAAAAGRLGLLSVEEPGGIVVSVNLDRDGDALDAVLLAPNANDEDKVLAGTLIALARRAGGAGIYSLSVSANGE